MNRLAFVTRYDWIVNADGLTDLKQGEIPRGESEERLAIGLVFRPLGQLQFKSEYLYRNNRDANDNQGLAFQVVANW